MPSQSTAKMEFLFHSESHQELREEKKKEVLSALWEFIIHGKYKPLNRSIIH
jgi:hypothetical protein